MKVTKKLLEQTIKEVLNELSPPAPIGRDRLERIAAKEAAAAEAGEPESAKKKGFIQRIKDRRAARKADRESPQRGGAARTLPKDYKPATKVGDVFTGNVGDPYQYMEVSPGNFQARRGAKGEWKDVKSAKAIASIKSVRGLGKSHWKPEASPSTGESAMERSMRLARERGTHPEQEQGMEKARTWAAQKGLGMSDADVAKAESGLSIVPQAGLLAARFNDMSDEDLATKGYFRPGSSDPVPDPVPDPETGLLPGETEEDLMPGITETYKRWGELIK